MNKDKNNKDIELGTLIENFTDKIDFVTEHVIAIKEVQDSHSGKFEKIDERFDGIEIRIDKVETKLDRVETRLDGVETKLDRVETRLDGVETKLDRVETKLDRKADIKDVENLDRRVFAIETKS